MSKLRIQMMLLPASSLVLLLLIRLQMELGWLEATTGRGLEGGRVGHRI